MSVPEAPSHVAGNVPGPSLLPTVTSDTAPLVAADDVPTAHDTPQDAQPGVSSIPVTDSIALPDSALAASPPEPPAPTPQTAQVLLCFLLVSGRRRNMTFDPETTVGRVKELVWNAWPADWQDERPPGPSSLRILHLGKILQDEDTLQKLSFPTQVLPAATAPSLPATIVHLSIRPFAPSSDDADGFKKKRRQGSSTAPDRVAETEHGAGCCGGCIIC